MTQFTDLALAEPIAKAVAAEGYTRPTPIQLQAIPHVLSGRDLLGIAQTGTGKTAAFALPILDRLARNAAPPRGKSARVLVLAPTRELASQIAQSFETYGKFLRLTVQTVFGGVPINRQIKALHAGVDVLVATPGRLIDLVEQKALRLDTVEVLVLDEADQMLDLGFVHALKRIVTFLPKSRQTLLFSATMPTSIADLAGRYLVDPAQVSVAPAATTAERVAQSAMFLRTDEKQDVLAHLLRTCGLDRALVFTRTKHGADRVVKRLAAVRIEAVAIHGNKSQAQREKALEAFRGGRIKILVATDIAARGLDIDGVSHIFNFDVPNVPEQYVHRIGRTARAGASGLALSLVGPDERSYLRDIEKLTRIKIPVEPVPEDVAKTPTPAPDPRDDMQRQGQGQRQGENQSRGGQGGGRNGQRTDARGGNGGRSGQQGRGGDRPRGENAGGARDGAQQPTQQTGGQQHRPAAAAQAPRADTAQPRPMASTTPIRPAEPRRDPAPQPARPADANARPASGDAPLRRRPRNTRTPEGVAN